MEAFRCRGRRVSHPDKRKDYTEFNQNQNQTKRDRNLRYGCVLVYSLTPCGRLALHDVSPAAVCHFLTSDLRSSVASLRLIPIPGISSLRSSTCGCLLLRNVLSFVKSFSFIEIVIFTLYFISC
jgi:hypothetical protein